MQLTFLGTGTSAGVPVIGCDCAVCTSPDPLNKRLRTSALLRVANRHILFDAGPDFRAQALAHNITRLDAIVLTHAHYDHVAGLDDVRPLNLQGGSMPIYGSPATLASVRERFSYAFADSSDGSTRPALDLVPITHYEPFSLGPLTLLPFDIMHGSWLITGYRIGNLAYVTDASAIPPVSFDLLYDLDLLVLNALRPRPHPTHLSLPQALDIIDQVHPRRALLVHMNHLLDHQQTNAQLPAGVALAHDGLTVEIAGEAPCESG